MLVPLQESSPWLLSVLWVTDFALTELEGV